MMKISNFGINSILSIVILLFVVHVVRVSSFQRIAINTKTSISNKWILKDSKLRSTYRQNEYDEIQKHHRMVADKESEELMTGRGSVASIDLHYPISPAETAYIGKQSSSGFAGIQISLEGAMIDCKEAAAAATDAVWIKYKLNREAKERFNSVDEDFFECFNHMDFNFKSSQIAEMEQSYYRALISEIDKHGVHMLPGIERFLLDAIDDGNEICIISKYPRLIALKLLQKTPIASILSTSLPISCLISSDIVETARADYFSDLSQQPPHHCLSRLNLDQQLIRGCHLMKKNSNLVVYIDSNAEKIRTVKHLGFNTMAILRDQSHLYDLQVANKVCQSSSDLTLDNVYKVIRFEVETIDGTSLQSFPAMQRDPRYWQSPSPR